MTNVKLKKNIIAVDLCKDLVPFKFLLNSEIRVNYCKKKLLLRLPFLGENKNFELVNSLKNKYCL